MFSIRELLHTTKISLCSQQNLQAHILITEKAEICDLTKDVNTKQILASLACFPASSSDDNDLEMFDMK